MIGAVVRVLVLLSMLIAVWHEASVLAEMGRDVLLADGAGRLGARQVGRAGFALMVVYAVAGLQLAALCVRGWLRPRPWLRACAALAMALGCLISLYMVVGLLWVSAYESLQANTGELLLMLGLPALFLGLSAYYFRCLFPLRPLSGHHRRTGLKEV